jgi:D-alanine-D-alanine ligase
VRREKQSIAACRALPTGDSYLRRMEIVPTSQSLLDGLQPEQQRVRVGVLFGGRSGEHEVSLVSAESILSALNPELYEIIPIGITKEGWWITGPDTLDVLKGRIEDGEVSECVLATDPTASALYAFNREGEAWKIPVDVIFPVLHGTFGEDGTVQGLCELAGIPFVGSGVLASAIGMDKVVQKKLHRYEGLPVVDFVDFRATDFADNPVAVLDRIGAELGFPVFVKPPNLGSSVGIAKARTREEAEQAIGDALRYDRTVIVEKAVPNAREIEVAVLGNENPVASVPGEIIPSNEFYDYDAKYVDGASQSVIPADLDPDLADRIRALAVKAFLSIGCEGMARVDFLLSRDDGALYLNEVNTIPGFTSISMYPKLFEADGIAYGDLLDRLIAFALLRQEQRSTLQRSFSPKTDWHLRDDG